MTHATDRDVLIVGGGPTGAALALLLAQQQVRVIMVDRAADIYPLPRAAHLDHEAMRILQSLGVAGDIMVRSRSVARYDFLSAQGDILMRFDGGDLLGPGGWPFSNMIHQPTVERYLRARIEQEQHIDFYTGWRFESYTESAASIQATLTTPDGMQTLTTRFLVGADGTRSPVRESAGIVLDDLQFDEPWLVIDAIVQDASRLPQANLQICDPARPTTCILMGEGRHRWEFMIMPNENPDDLLDDDVIASLLAPWNVEDCVMLERKAVYRFNARVARKWCQGRVLLAGDAAHQMPPFAGQGMCSGQRDAANLAWKLGAVLRGAPKALLDDYQKEREPNVRAIIDMSIMMGRTVCITDATAAAKRDASMLTAYTADSAPSQPLVYPPITAGCILARTPGAGSYFPQVVGADQSLLDDVLANSAWLIRRGAAQLQTAISGRELQIVAVDDTLLAPFREALMDWLNAHDAPAVLVRPDRYVFGTGDDQTLVAAWHTVLAA